MTSQNQFVFARSLENRSGIGGFSSMGRESFPVLEESAPGGCDGKVDSGDLLRVGGETQSRSSTSAGKMGPSTQVRR